MQGSSSKVAQIVPLKQITEPDDKSIPPAIMTIADPSEKIPRSDVCRAISTQLVHGIVDIVVLGIEDRRQRDDDENGEDETRLVAAQKSEGVAFGPRVDRPSATKTLQGCNGSTIS